MYFLFPRKNGLIDWAIEIGVICTARGFETWHRNECLIIVVSRVTWCRGARFLAWSVNRTTIGLTDRTAKETNWTHHPWHLSPNKEDIYLLLWDYFTQCNKDRQGICNLISRIHPKLYTSNIFTSLLAQKMICVARLHFCLVKSPHVPDRQVRRLIQQVMLLHLQCTFYKYSK